MALECGDFKNKTPLSPTSPHNVATIGIFTTTCQAFLRLETVKILYVTET